VTSAPHVLICGTSTRAVADSAARAGYRVTTIDAFGDIDQHPSVRALSAARDLASLPTAPAIARAARTVDAEAVVYLSPFENHRNAVATLAAGRSLWGNPPAVLRRVRDAFLLAEALRPHGFAVPRSYDKNAANDPNAPNAPNAPNDPNDPNDPTVPWLSKPFRSGGGNRIRPWRGEAVPRTSFLQQRVDGIPGSLVFVAARGECVPLGLSRQLIGDPHFGGNGYRYCGSILAGVDDHQFAHAAGVFKAAHALAAFVTAEFGLVGINGIDFVARDGVPFFLEVNPRWSSSVELAERGFGLPCFSIHADACAQGRMPSFDCAAALARSAAFGKAIVYARHDGDVGDTARWLDDPDVRDVPRTGQYIRSGQPICSVFARAADSSSCYRLLVSGAASVYAHFRSAARVSAVSGVG
jgi:predicted ATP-grasp superfamily ATP-dependent carboligase